LADDGLIARIVEHEVPYGEQGVFAQI